MGVPYEKLPGTGLIAIIEGGKPGKNKILRADIDALPLQEETENLKQPKVCVSEIPGRCLPAAMMPYGKHSWNNENTGAEQRRTSRNCILLF